MREGPAGAGDRGRTGLRPAGATSDVSHMSASRSTIRLLTASAALVFAAGLFSAAHADQDVTDVVGSTTGRHLSLPVQVAAPAAPTVLAEAAPPVAPARPEAAPAPAPPTPEAAPAPAPAPPAPSAPAPAPAAPPAPAPAPTPQQDPQPAAAEPTGTDAERIERGYTTAVPAAWRRAITASFEVIPGSTSWASSTGRISIAEDHMATSDLLVDVIAHEFGHLIAFRYGSQEYAGAPPAGWPAPADRPEEAWADCVQRVFLGRSNPSHGLPPCEGEQLRAAQRWLDQGPDAHTRTG